MREILYQFNPWWERAFETETVLRDGYLTELMADMDSRDIVFLIGIRRVGKTTIMHQLIEALLNTTDAKRILYVSLEHPQFLGKTLPDILREYRTIHGLERDEKTYLFFDEIHMKEGFERDLKVLYDMEKAKIFASGSSALAIRHRGAFLTGRYRKVNVQPLSFDEFMRFRGVEIRESERYLYEKHLLDYMRTGGMPEHVLRNEPNYLLELIESVIYKDIVARYGLKKPDILKNLILLLAERVGKRLTYNKLSKVLGVSPDTVKQYVGYFEETFLVYQVPKHARSLNERIYSPKKIYFADVGMRNVLTGFRDIGSVAENLVFLKIKDRGEVFYHYENGKEVDFVVGGTAVEVKYRDDVTERDLEALRAFRSKDRVMVTKKGGSFDGIKAISLSEFLRNRKERSGR